MNVIVWTLLFQSKQILREIENNETIQEGWKTWMKKSVWYLLDQARDELFAVWRLEQIIDETKTDEDYHNDFDCEIWYSVNDVVEKQFEKLNNYFISLQNK